MSCGKVLPSTSAVYGLFNINETINIPPLNVPVQLQNGAIFICLDGEGEFILDMKRYRIRKGDLCVAFPFTLIQTIGQSEDFKGYGQGVNTEFINNIQMPSITSFYLYIKENPCISLTLQEQKTLLELCDMIREKVKNEDNPFCEEIVDKLLMALCYEVASIYTQRQPIAQQPRSRQDIIFLNFLFSLAHNYKKSRDVNFYAQEQCVSPRYFSTVVKERSGLSAAQWITNTVVRQAKILLTSSQLTIQQIADELNFANPSFFGQYFKKYTGMTPKKFRDMG